MPEIKEQKQKSKKKKKQFISPFIKSWLLQYYQQAAIGIAAILFLAGYIFVLHPALKHALNLSVDEYEKEMKEKSRLEERLAYLVDLSNKRKEVRESEIERVSEMLPKDSQTPQLITSLEGIAEQSGVTIEGIEISIINEYNPEEEASIMPQVPSGIGIIEISLGLKTGPYEQVKMFLSNLEKDLRILDVIALTYSPIEEGYSVVVRSYYLPHN